MADYNGDLKVVVHRLDALTDKIDKIDDNLDPVCDMVIRHDEKIKVLQKRSNFWNAGNSLGLAVTAALAYLRGG